MAQQEQEWTWTGDTDALWTEPGNWDCAGDGCPDPLTFPNHVDAEVIITASQNIPVVDDIGADSYQIKSLTLNTNAALIIPLGDCAMNAECMGLKVLEHDGLVMSSGSILSIEGGYLELRNGGKLDIHPDARIEFAITPGGRLVLTRGGEPPYRAPLFEIPGGSTNEVIRAKVHGTIEGHHTGTDDASIGSGGASTLVLCDREITGLLTISVRLINNGRVVADESNHWITLSCQPKGGSGLWRIAYAGAKIVVNVPVTGTDQSKIELIDGVLAIADIWATSGTFDWQGGTVSTDPGVALFVGESVSCNE